ncbi:response regulator transcription factor [Clostridium kluyveri]|uniref:response regulator transcription factor n=1 Tax=Clostridium kluyveri TaxID=1534 RepID=UPI0022460556|nr:response regulator [Clostridium kluyveri]UZQ51827.1 response regulator [Clostridium kluyveri]
MYKIIMLDDTAYVRYRVKDILEGIGMELCESGTSFDFFNKLYDNKKELNLIILEVGLSSEDGFSVLRKIKGRGLNIPVMVLTKLSDRSSFIKCIKEGTSDYILKPFNNKLLIDRISKLVVCHENSNKPEEIIHLNFQQYIVRQVTKCKAESKKFSIIMVSLIKEHFTELDEKIEVRDRYLILIDFLYNQLKVIFKISDLFEKYGLSTFVGVLPDCDEKKVISIINSMKLIYTKLKAIDKRYSEYTLQCSFVVFPEDGEDKQQLLDKLTVKMKLEMIRS